MPPIGQTLNISIGLVLVVVSFYYWFVRLWDERMVDVIIAIVVFSLGVAIVYSNIHRESGKVSG